MAEVTSLPPCALAGPKVWGVVQCARYLAKRYYGVASSIVPSVRCDPSVGQIQAPADDLESWRRLGAAVTEQDSNPRDA